MDNQMHSLKTLLLQIRETSHVCHEELQSFSKYTGLNMEQISVFNMFQNPDFHPEIVNGYDGIFVGGASKASVLEPENFPFILNAQKLLLYCIEKDIPVFASCFGFQLAVIALGGDIIRDVSDYEMGTIEITRSTEVYNDPIFSTVPRQFLAVSVHQERTITPPENCQLLAYTDSCCHAFRVKNKPFWAFQFHPEVDRDILIQRLTVYKSKYTDNDLHLNEVINSAQETPVSNSLAKTFVQNVLLA
ncbi:MAG: type 1 glutamine amidotransferase [Candidatus Marinimicrobia bacterium]|jgi:GMP synthase (glutamine-hydrolysing)|nr:type 1 glutamine amidotransferase [Candidatus Neomarinimicrobiota bacterium]MBT3634283.1 type 1 glutamine amidotransferase [Candidatus Neomarinimicrobiota bacterium]MBT3682918.1 type 1 glutamine amidotransferase [Candidatus Neomarinimicrobiota bacterium]MBT3760092.1 type 1 glutamine amidotransferase [Candidatus Neomarinimicrobiota bacterium]MBT3896141.1 type 1 glutamine amidotransferase [Candidatus Neomarinimicrobiota bacterium]